jgi:hypothetical protein
VGAKRRIAVTFEVVGAQVQILQRQERCEVGAKRGCAVSLKEVAAQVQTLQRRERRKVGAKRGCAVSLKEAASAQVQITRCCTRSRVLCLSWCASPA